jgi:hypothetical protein
MTEIEILEQAKTKKYIIQKLEKGIRQIEAGKFDRVKDLLLMGSYQRNEFFKPLEIGKVDEVDLYQKIRWVIFAELKTALEEYEKEYQELVRKLKEKPTEGNQ